MASTDTNVQMFGYTLPSYMRISPADLKAYRRFYCEGCHQLKEGFGLRGTFTVNYDMTFNTILLNGVMGDVHDFEGTTKKLCVFEKPHADSDMMRDMAAYTLILTKWELYDDDTDKPSFKSRAISSVLRNAMEKAARMHPDWDAMVGEGFMNLHQLELDGCKDILLMGRTFGHGLIGALQDIAGDKASKDLDTLFTELSTAVYVMDSIDDLNDDFMDGTYNPLLPEKGFVNAEKLIAKNLYEFTGIVSETVGLLQGAYSNVRKDMKANVGICDNIVYFGIPESARKVLMGTATAKASVKNILSNRSDRLSEVS